MGTKRVLFTIVSVALLALFGTYLVSEMRPDSVGSQSTAPIDSSKCKGLAFPNADTPPFRRGNLSSPLPGEAFDSEAVGPYLLGPLSTELDLYRLNTSIFIPSDSIENLDDILEVGEAYTLGRGSGNPILVVEFTICGHERKAYALGQETTLNSAVLMIPGTGENQSSEIYFASKENYHCCLLPLLRDHDTYVQILPNQDQRAWHNGRGSKISWNYILRWQINNGGSYSASYMAETIALKKYLSSQNDSVALVGLSQGGNAALIAASISAPDALVVASGYSIGQIQTEFADEFQITLPGVSLLLSPESINNQLVFPTLFSFGLLETGLYGREATSRETCDFFYENPFVECAVHSRGHVYPDEMVVNFLDRTLTGSQP
jgi:pimeloyl-ACP methyl ester carboxylesterase